MVDANDLRPKPRFSERDLTGYRLSRAIEQAAGIAPRNGLEAEVHDELQRDKSHPWHGVGFLMPSTIPAIRGAHEVATASKGGELKYTEAGPFIDLLFRRAWVRRLGATVLNGLSGDVFLPRKTASMLTEWQSESQTADTSASAMLFDHVALTPRQLSGTTSVSRKLLWQAKSSAAEIDRKIGDDFSRAFGTEIDRVAIIGSGTSNQPMGILNTAGIGSVVGGTNGLVPGYDHAVDLEHELGIDNADDSPALAFLTTSQVRKRLRKAAAVSAASGLPAWSGRNPGELLGYPAASSQNVPSNLTKGTSTTICSAIIFGAWDELILGEWGAIALIVDPYKQARKADIEVTAVGFVDVGLRHAPSFAAMVDALP